METETTTGTLVGSAEEVKNGQRAVLGPDTALLSARNARTTTRAPSGASQRGPRSHTQASDNGLSPHFQSALNEQMSQMRAQIEEQAIQIARQANTGSEAEAKVSLSDLAAALETVTTGGRPPATRVERFFDYFPPFTCICALLCIGFAWLGLSPLTKATGVDPKVAEKLVLTSTGFLDIAKIFAGAIVGSATTAIAVRAAKRKR